MYPKISILRHLNGKMYDKPLDLGYPISRSHMNPTEWVLYSFTKEHDMLIEFDQWYMGILGLELWINLHSNKSDANQPTKLYQ